MYRLFTIKAQDLDHNITLEVVWRFNSQGEPITDQDQERLEAASVRIGGRPVLDVTDPDYIPAEHLRVLDVIESDIIEEQILEVWMEWLGDWDFSVFDNLMMARVGIQHEIKPENQNVVADQRMVIPLAPDQCEIIEATVTIKEIGGSGLDTGWEVC